MVDGRVQLAEGMIASRSYGPALEVLRQHLKGNPGDVRARSLVGLAEYQLGHHSEAEDAFRAVLRERPDDVPTLYNLGVTLERLGNVDEARVLIGRAAGLDPNYRPAQERLKSMISRPAAPTTMGRPGEDPARLTPGDLLHSGTRRLSSFMGTFILAAGLALVGAVVVSTDRPGRLSWLGDALTFPSPTFLAEVLEKSKGGPFEASAQADYDRAVQQSAALADVLDRILVVLGFALGALGLLLVIRSIIASRVTRYDIFERRIDVARGVMNRHRDSAWLFEIQDVRLRQPPWLTLTRNAEIRIRLQDKTKVRIIGLGTLAQQIELREDLRDAGLRERRALKQIWV